MRTTTFAILFFLSYVHVSWCQSYNVNSETDNIKIKDYEYLIDKEGNIEIEDILSGNLSSLFQQEKNDFTLNLKNEHYWIKFDLTNLEPEAVDYLLEFSLWPYVDLYYRAGDTIVHRKSGLALHHGAIDFPLGLNNLLEVALNGRQTITCYVRLRFVFIGGLEPTSLTPSISKEELIVKRKYFSQSFSLMFLGIFLMMFLYNLFIYYSTKDKAYRFYLLSLLIYVFTLIGFSGVFYYLVPNLESGPMLFLIPMSTQSILLTLAILYFVKDFYRVSSRYPRWGKAIDYFSLFLGAVLLLMPFAFDLSVQLQVVSIIPFMVIVFAIGFKSLRDGFPGAIYVISGHIIWFVFGIAAMLGQVHPVIKEIEFFSTHALYTGASIEMFLFALALANTINYLMKENKEKQQRIISQLKEYTALQNEVNSELEDKVKERTKEILMKTQEVEAQKQNLELEKERAEGLLLNILPMAVAAELKGKGNFTPKFYKDVTVLFVDISNFSAMVRKLSPEELVDGLHYLFSEFDEVTTKYGLEKIKTIGDSYMCVGGLPIINETHPIDAVEAASEMIEITKGWIANKMDLDVEGINLRAGIHTGPVTGGVVGKKKFQFDIWGDAVNLASRMESGGAPGKINVSKSTYHAIKDKFNCTYRGKFPAKNMGEVNMYFVENRFDMVNSPKL